MVSALRSLFTNTVVLLAIGGAVGTNSRYWLGYWLGEASWRSHYDWLAAFPVGTFVINVTGSFVLGLVGVVFLEKMPEYRSWFLLLGTGFCGGYTTFSTFEWETYRLLLSRSYALAATNVLASVAIGFLGVVLGAALGDFIYRNA
jgi:CrcB protein